MDFYLNECKIIKKIGKGSFGEAYLIIDKKESKYCRKDINLEGMSEKDKNSVDNEVF